MAHSGTHGMSARAAAAAANVRYRGACWLPRSKPAAGGWHGIAGRRTRLRSGRPPSPAPGGAAKSSTTCTNRLQADKATRPHGHHVTCPTRPVPPARLSCSPVNREHAARQPRQAGRQSSLRSHLRPHASAAVARAHDDLGRNALGERREVQVVAQRGLVPDPRRRAEAVLEAGVGEAGAELEDGRARVEPAHRIAFGTHPHRRDL
jgi:hypothetical protein